MSITELQSQRKQLEIIQDVSMLLYDNVVGNDENECRRLEAIDKHLQVLSSNFYKRIYNKEKELLKTYE